MCIAMAIEVVDRFELVGTGRGTRQEGKQAERQTGRGTWQTHIYIYVGTQSSRDGCIERERRVLDGRRQTDGQARERQKDKQIGRHMQGGAQTKAGETERQTRCTVSRSGSETWGGRARGSGRCKQ